jgi:hypothetical protein
LLAKGKPKKVALTAAMRKLLTILNALVKSNQLWRVPTTCPTELASVSPAGNHPKQNLIANPSNTRVMPKKSNSSGTRIPARNSWQQIKKQKGIQNLF